MTSYLPSAPTYFHEHWYPKSSPPDPYTMEDRLYMRQILRDQMALNCTEANLQPILLTIIRSLGSYHIEDGSSSMGCKFQTSLRKYVVEGCTRFDDCAFQKDFVRWKAEGKEVLSELRAEADKLALREMEGVDREVLEKLAEEEEEEVVVVDQPER